MEEEGGTQPQNDLVLGFARTHLLQYRIACFSQCKINPCAVDFVWVRFGQQTVAHLHSECTLVLNSSVLGRKCCLGNRDSPGVTAPIQVLSQAS